MKEHRTIEELNQIEADAAASFMASANEEFIPQEIPDHLNQAPNMPIEDLSFYAEQIENHDEESPFYFDAEDLAAPEVKAVEVDDSTDKVIEDWEELLLKARESRMAKISGGSFVVNGLIQNNEPGIMYGDSGSKKTFLAVHMACCIASGAACFGKGVRQGLVYYFAPEDATGVRERIRGWEQAYNNGRPLATMQLVPTSFDFTDREKQDRFIASIEKLYSVLPPDRRKTSLVVIDTLSRNIATMSRNGKELDENSNNDMAYVMDKASEVCKRLGCALLFIHHSGKDAEKGARGASALRANVGFEIAVRSIKGQTAVIMEPSKLKMAGILPKRKVEFMAQPLPEELLAERAEARRELCPDEDSGWSVEEYNTTLVPRQHLQPVDEQSEGSDEQKGRGKTKEPTHAEKIALFVRREAGHHGVPEDAVIEAMTYANTIQGRGQCKRAIQKAIDQGYISMTPAGNLKHKQGASDQLAERFGITPQWQPKTDQTT